jgi:hypothetical protein
MQIAVLTAIFDREPVIIWDYEIPDQDASDKKVREEFII